MEPVGHGRHSDECRDGRAWEATVLERCRAGDSEAFRVVYERYSDVLFRTALLMTRSRSDAEDALQEAFVAAWKNIDSYTPGTDLKSWLLTILLNNVRSWRRRLIRRASKVPFVPLETGVEEPVIVDEPLDSIEVSRLMTALHRLSHEHRSAVVLRYYSGLSVPEIARMLSTSEGTIKSRLHRSLKKLREQLTSGSEIVAPQTER